MHPHQHGGLFSDVIADQVMGYVVCFARNLHTYIRRQLERRWGTDWRRSSPSRFAMLTGLVSPIDRSSTSRRPDSRYRRSRRDRFEIARRAKAFGMRVVAIDPVRTQPPAEVEWLRPPTRLPELLAESDYVVIAAPHTPATAKMFGRTQFRQMKPSAYLINIGRGAIVDLGELVESLRAKEIAGAALDVYEVEPLPSGHPLWDFPNVILTPHVAGYSPRIAERHLGVLVENVRRFVAGEPLLNVVDKKAWF